MCILRFEKYFTSSFGDKTPFYSFCFDYSFFKANDGKLLERILMGFFLFFQIKAQLSAHSSGHLRNASISVESYLSQINKGESKEHFITF